MATSAYEMRARQFKAADLDFDIVNFGYQDVERDHRQMKMFKFEHVLQYMLGGRGTYEVGGKTYALRAGDLFYLPKNVLLSYYADPRDPYRYYWLGIDGKAARSLLESAALTEKNPVVRYDDPQIAAYFRNIEAGMENGTATGYLTAKGAACELLGYLLSYNRENRLMQRSAASEYVEQAVLYIKNHFNDNIGVADVAERIGVGRSYLSRIFVEQLAVSPVEFLIDYRIRQAQKMLQFGLSVTETAINCGFNSPAHFSVQFKNRTGQSPLDYKRARRE